ncbi:DOMON-like domain-containing protein [Chamaesiphon sp.]|uniref:DOMON-like domain-containing protein n=1 Tax=Chamaesiphon sp. TaxID=2814140 RepID=UPI003593BF8F
MNNFSLVPFAVDSVPPIEIVGNIDRSGHLLAIDYQLLGELDSVAIPSPAAAPSRKFGLWEATCFEFFIGVIGDRNYWEFNLSPSGDWNVFHLDDYRQGLRDETAFTSLPFDVDRFANSLTLKLVVDLSQIISIDRELEVSVTTVIKSTQDDISYWALTHCGEEADFHLRDSFVIKL